MISMVSVLHLLDIKRLLGVDVDDHPIGILVGESASDLAGVPLGVATNALDGAVEAVFVRSLAATRTRGNL